jgi:exonuclease VII small subunit
VARFEQGMKLSAECSAMLDQAELRVSILVNGPDGERTLAPFEGE